MKKSTYGLGFEKLKQLLSLGTGCPVPETNPCSSDKLSFALLEHLNTPLGRASDPMKPLTQILESQAEAGILKEQTVMKILLNPHTGIDILRLIKTYGKGMSNPESGKLEQALGTTLYHGAIAGALVFHNETITTSDTQKLKAAFTLLAEKEWTPPEIKKLYEQANIMCGQKEP